MSLSPEEIKAIIEYRVEKSAQALKEAKDNAALGNWSLVVNRLYYATFYMVLVLLLKTNQMPKSHNGTYQLFNKNFIANGKLSKEEGRIYRKLFSMRNTGDYDDFFDWEEEDVRPLLSDTENLLNTLRKML